MFWSKDHTFFVKLYNTLTRLKVLINNKRVKVNPNPTQFQDKTRNLLVTIILFVFSQACTGYKCQNNWRNKTCILYSIISLKYQSKKERRGGGAGAMAMAVAVAVLFRPRPRLAYSGATRGHGPTYRAPGPTPTLPRALFLPLPLPNNQRSAADFNTCLLDQITLFWRIFQTLTIIYPLMTVLLWELYLNPRHTSDRVQSPAGSYSCVWNL